MSVCLTRPAALTLREQRTNTHKDLVTTHDVRSLHVVWRQQPETQKHSERRENTGRGEITFGLLIQLTNLLFYPNLILTKVMNI